MLWPQRRNNEGAELARDTPAALTASTFFNIVTTYRNEAARPWLMSKERQRYYLLPGMGGSAMRRKRKLILQWSIATGLCVSAVVAGLLYFIYTSQHH